MKLSKFTQLMRGALCAVLIGIIIIPPSQAKKNGPFQQEKPLVEVLEEFSEKYQVLFSYDSKSLNEINVEFYFREDESMESAISRLLTPIQLGYESFGKKYYVIYAKNKKGQRKAKKVKKHLQKIQKLEDEGGLSVQRTKASKVDQIRSIAKTIQEIKQRTPVTGTVIDEAGEPLIGVNILIKGSRQGTITDLNGRFNIDVEDTQSTLIVSYIGYETKEVPLNGQTKLQITMQTNTAALEEVLVVGYGSIQKSDLTGSVASVKSEDLTAYPAQDALQALQGRAAGVNIQSTNGQPGSDFRISIRGNTSVSADSEPLIVVDGLVGGILPPPEDIESIEILKDASATAIYGSRGANGVVLVSTKGGIKGKPQINFSSSFSSQEEIGRLDLLTGNDFFDYVNSANSASAGIFNAANFSNRMDWQDQILQTGNIQNYQLSASGGSEGISYYVSGVHFNQEGIIINSEFERSSLSSTINADVNDNLNISLSSLLQRSTQIGVETQQGTGSGAGGNRIGVMTSAFKTEPLISIFDENGDFNQSNFDPFWENPVAVSEGFQPETVLDVIQTNLKGTYDLSGLIEGLSINSSLGVSIRNSRRGAYASKRLQLSSPTGAAEITTNRNTDLLTEHYLSFDRQFGGSKLSLIGGYSFQSFHSEFYRVGSADFINDSFEEWSLQAGSTPGTPQSALIESEIASFYGRVNYNYGSRYLLTFTGRYDGSSQFAEGNKWSFFPSVALGWNISNESFFPENNILSSLKFRSSFGQTGNRAISPYQTFARLSNSFLNPNLPALVPTSVANEELSWETTTQVNIGLNMGLFENRVQVEMDYYTMNTDDLLFFRSDLPLFSGFSSRLENIGEIQNRGFELAINSKNLTGAFSWSTNFNISFNQSEVISLPDGEEQFITGSPFLQAGTRPISNILREGDPVGAIFGWQYEGVYQNGDDFIPGTGFEQAAGGERFADINGDGVIDANDRIILGDPNPDFIFGLTNTFAYKGFDLNIFIQGAQGNELFNATRMDLDLANGAHNGTTDLLNRWTSSNTDTDVPAVNQSRLYRTSSRWIEDGSYIRLKNIGLGYSLPAKVLERLKIRSFRVFASAQNILTITDYTGIDPEVQYNISGSNLNLGIDYGSYPNAKTYTFGFNIGL